MGTWNTKPFGNDSALDWFIELENSKNGVDKISYALNQANNESVEDIDIGEQAIAAASLVAAASLDKIKGINPEAKLWIQRSAFSPTKEIKQLAIDVIQRIKTNSDLKELWEESGDLHSWLNELEKINNILHDYLDQSTPNRKPKAQRMPRTFDKLIDLYLTHQDSKVKKKLIEKFSKIEDPNSHDSSTAYDLPLNLATKAGLLEVVENMLDKGADPNSASMFGNKPLALSCAYGFLEVAKVLLKRGADLFDKHENLDENGIVTEVIDVCVPILFASRVGSPELIELLVSYGASTNEIDLNGETLLHKAADSGNIKMIEYLISAGLDVNQHKRKADDKNNYQGESPLHYTVNRNQLQASKLLIDNGANINAFEYFFGSEHKWINTPLDLISEKQDTDIYSFLKSKGAKLSSELSEADKLTRLYSKK